MEDGTGDKFWTSRSPTQVGNSRCQQLPAWNLGTGLWSSFPSQCTLYLGLFKNSFSAFGFLGLGSASVPSPLGAGECCCLVAMGWGRRLQQYGTFLHSSPFISISSFPCAMPAEGTLRFWCKAFEEADTNVLGKLHFLLLFGYIYCCQSIARSCKLQHWNLIQILFHIAIIVTSVMTWKLTVSSPVEEFFQDNLFFELNDNLTGRQVTSVYFPETHVFCCFYLASIFMWEIWVESPNSLALTSLWLETHVTRGSFWTRVFTPSPFLLKAFPAAEHGCPLCPGE